MVSFVVGLIGGILGVYGFFTGSSSLIVIGGILCIGCIIFDMMFGGLNSITTTVIGAVIGFLIMHNYLGILFGICAESLLMSVLGLISMMGLSKK